MYRDDECAVCGTALPPDHAYCREHAAEVDDRLHEVGVLLDRALDDLPRLSRLLSEIAPETWDWLSDEVDDDRDWPPPLALALQVHADEFGVDVDSEPGRVRIDLQTSLRSWCSATASALDVAGLKTVAQACTQARGADAAY